MIIRSLTIFAFVISVLNATNVVAEVTIDNYTVGSTIAQLGQGTSIQTTNDASILGGSRDTVLTVPNLGGSELFGVVGFAGNLQLAQGSNDEIQGSLTYDDFTSIDLTEGGVNTMLALRIVATDSIGPVNNSLAVTVFSGGNSDTVNMDIPAATGFPRYAVVDFADFGGGVDFSSVDSVELAFDFAANPGENILARRLFATNSIPEPGSIALLAGLVMAIAGRRRR